MSKIPDYFLSTQYTVTHCHKYKTKEKIKYNNDV
jgi:hypothetical protein